MKNRNWLNRSCDRQCLNILVCYRVILLMVLCWSCLSIKILPLGITLDIAWVLKSCHCNCFCMLLLYFSTRAELFSSDEGLYYVFSTQNNCLFKRVSCILWCYYSKCYSIILENNSFVVLHLPSLKAYLFSGLGYAFPVSVEFQNQWK